MSDSYDWEKADKAMQARLEAEGLAGDDLPDTSGWSDGPRMTPAQLAVRMQWPRCRQCGTILYMGMRQTAQYCSNACKCKAYRERKKET